MKTNLIDDRAVIRIAGVKKIYRMGTNEVAALQGVDLTVKPGEMISVMGSSGSGYDRWPKRLRGPFPPPRARCTRSGLRTLALSLSLPKEN